MNSRITEDFLIYNDGNDFSIGSGDAVKKYHTDDLIADKNFISVGEFFSLELFEDNCINVRVVIGSLTEQEAAEWVGHVRSNLDLRCGELGISSALVMFENDPDETAFRLVKVPASEYQIDVYAYFPSFTGIAETLTASLMDCEFVPIAQWFRKTRPGEDFPPWLTYQCLESYDTDPEHEEFWEKWSEDMDEKAWEDLREKAGKYVEFLVQLSPLMEDIPAPEVYASGACLWNARRIERCPSGLYSEDIESDLA